MEKAEKLSFHMGPYCTRITGSAVPMMATKVSRDNGKIRLQTDLTLVLVTGSEVRCSNLDLTNTANLLVG